MSDAEVRRLEEKLDGALAVLNRLDGTLSIALPALQKTQGDHETRIRSLERFRFSVPSIAVLSLLVSIVVLAYYVLGGQG